MWLLEKTTTAGGTGKVASREVAVFKLTSVDEISDSDLVDITYRLLFGVDFSDQHPVASNQFVTTNDQHGFADITVTATDDGELNAEQDFRVTVKAVNDKSDPGRL